MKKVIGPVDTVRRKVKSRSKRREASHEVGETRA